MTKEEVKQKIEETLFMTGGNSESEKGAFKTGAEYGYGLAQEEIHTLSGFLKERIKRDDERQAEIARLTAQNQRMIGLIEWCERFFRAIILPFGAIATENEKENDKQVEQLLTEIESILNDK